MTQILILKITDRYHQGLKLQEILTKFGCEIRVRLGLHETSSQFCSPEGIIILQLCGEATQIENLKRELKELEGIKQEYLEI